MTVAAAGAIWYYEEDGSFNYGQSLKLQWGVHRPDGSYQALGEVQPIDIFPQKAWRNLRFPLAWAPPEANVARIVADDPNLSDRPVVRVHPAAGAGAADRATVPRVADAGADGHRHRGELPVPAAVLRTPRASPNCPEYRILPNFKQMVSSSNKWQSAQDGGPFLFIQALLRTTAVPTYLRDDWYRDWGSIERYDRVVPCDAGAQRRHRARARSGCSAGAAADRSGRCHDSEPMTVT